jgi:hypothetical protein
LKPGTPATGGNSFCGSSSSDSRIHLSRLVRRGRRPTAMRRSKYPTKKPDVCVTPGFESSRRKRNPVSLPEAIRVRIGLGKTFHLC